MTNGKESKSEATFPQDLTLITNEKKEVKVDMNTNVKYSIKIYKTNAKSINDLFKKNKQNIEPSVKNPLKQMEYIPTKIPFTLKIKVN